MRTRWAVALVASLALIFGGIGSAALATAPVDLDSGFVTDAVGALSSDEAVAAELRLSDLAEASDADLFVVLVDHFTDPSDRIEWADQVAIDNGLGTHQYLLAIAVEGRSYYISADESGPLSDADLTRIENEIQPFLSDGDWAGAIDEAASRMDTSAAGAAGLRVLLVILAIAVVIGVIVWIVVAVRRRRAANAPKPPDPNDPYAQIDDDELERQAGSALVQTDDAITSSREELGFAIAQFGDDSTTVFTQTVEDAAAKLGEAFSLKQKLDDAEKDTREQRRAWHIQIIALCEQAADLLDDNVEAFEELRKLEKEAPQALERVKAARATAQQPVDAAPTALASLTAAYAPAALATVADNPTHAVERLALADNEIAEAEALLAEGKRGEAAFSIRTAEEASAQAVQLAQAVTALGTDLLGVEKQAEALIADLEADLAAAAQLSDSDGSVSAASVATRTAVDTARTALTAPARDPHAILTTLDEANTRIDAVIAKVRDAEARVERARRQLEQRIAQAQSRISAASEFINTRRGSVGATARTRLAEANDSVQRALSLQATDPESALSFASRAAQLAQEATNLAQSDVAGWGGGGLTTGWSGGYAGGGSSAYGGGGTSGLGSDILGGILGGLISGGGNRGGSWGGGGSSWRSGGGSSWRSGGGSSSRGYRPSGFGGGSRSSRSSGSRSSGGGRGRSGGGRGRSGGGRF